METSSFWGLTVLLLALVGIFSEAAAASDVDERPPNIVFILQDDIGFGDLGCYRHPYAATPNLDRLAEEGMLFRNFHVTGSTCSPSRTGFMTSRHPATYPNYMAEFGLQRVDTVTGLLRDRANYSTAHIGKWHIGPDESDGTYGIDSVRLISGRIDDERGKDADIYDAAIDFIEQNKNSEQPFYLNVWGHASHMPVMPHISLVREFKGLTVDRSRFVGRYQQMKFDKVSHVNGRIDRMMRKYVAELWAMDRSVGRLLQKLDDLGMTNNTIVVFSSDQGSSSGAMGYSGGLRGEKFSQYEGGVRVPFIVRWPGRVPANRVNCESAISALDWLPTLASISGIKIDPSRYEGEDVSDIWTGQSSRSRRNPLFFKISDADAKRSMLYGKWKLHWDGGGSVELYDINANFDEDENVYESNRNVGGAMLAQLKAWDETLPTRYALKKNVQKRPFDPDSKPIVVDPPEMSSAGIMNSPQDGRCHVGATKPVELEAVPEPELKSTKMPSKETQVTLPPTAAPAPQPTTTAVGVHDTNYLYMEDFESPVSSFSNLQWVPTISSGGGYVGEMIIPANPSLVTALDNGLNIDIESRKTLSLEALVRLTEPTTDDVRFRMILDFDDGSRVQGDYVMLASTEDDASKAPFVTYRETVATPSSAKAVVKVQLRLKNFSEGSRALIGYVEYVGVE